VAARSSTSNKNGVYIIFQFDRKRMAPSLYLLNLSPKKRAVKISKKVKLAPQNVRKRAGSCRLAQWGARIGAEFYGGNPGFHYRSWFKARRVQCTADSGKQGAVRTYGLFPF
jgi:hypothetical protein